MYVFNYFALGVLLIIVQVYCQIQSEFKKKDCLAPHTEPGATCKAHLIRYHWNQTLKACEEVIYGGCRATRNNFKTMEECNKVAGSICNKKCKK
ncbi:unnamed protein product [Psylliodes chrysocephalus]|uniref:BPTI/Kunitz inhibitor domain-containing protein n=1 Tax=Psylliodes chrysocephalus TaxID=3402493 RepID=A0A9P0CXG1_9CUCU|nr:unnamed protein product [Psylliodes chrysocephala]